ncbi:MAG: tyrosine-type recombinase/integrase [Pseudomonadota bacterium]|nr:tyrosine-type recombinase/integrase [Pseudomonadota bacterium]
MAKLDLPGLCVETHRSGNTAWRVRIEGNARRKITLPIGPDHPEFMELYRAARAGIKAMPQGKPEDRVMRSSLDWLMVKYLDHLAHMVEAGEASDKTLKQRKGLLARMCDMVTEDGDRFGDFEMEMPTHFITRARNQMAKTPGAAANMVKAIRAMYRWSYETGITQTNPAINISPPRPKGKGAIPWTVEDLYQFRDRHPPGSTAFLCLTLFMFTSCRISDAYLLGRKNEFNLDSETWLGWQPKKKGSSYVEIPILPPLMKVIRSATVIGETYLLTEYGQPFKSPEGLRNRIRKWCDEAGLPHLSSHGIRKGSGTMMIEMGCSVHDVMAVHGHSDSKTSDVYTKTFNRRKHAANAMAKLAGLDW